jgi:hypothetical protein
VRNPGTRPLKGYVVQPPLDPLKPVTTDMWIVDSGATSREGPRDPGACDRTARTDPPRCSQRGGLVMKDCRLIVLTL